MDKVWFHALETSELVVVNGLHKHCNRNVVKDLVHVLELLLFIWKSVHYVCSQVGDILCLLPIKFVDNCACL